MPSKCAFMPMQRQLHSYKDRSPYLSTWHTKFLMTDVVVNCIRELLSMGNELYKDYAETRFMDGSVCPGSVCPRSVYLGQCVLGQCVLGPYVLGQCVLCVLGQCALGQCVMGHCVMGHCVL